MRRNCNGLLTTSRVALPLSLSLSVPRPLSVSILCGTAIAGSNPCVHLRPSLRAQSCSDVCTRVSVRGRCVHSGGKTRPICAEWKRERERERERAARAAVDHPEARCSLYPFYSRLLPSDLYDSDAPSGSRFRGAHLPTAGKNIRPPIASPPSSSLSSVVSYILQISSRREQFRIGRKKDVFVLVFRQSFRVLAVDDRETERKDGGSESKSKESIAVDERRLGRNNVEKQIDEIPPEDGRK